MERVLRKKCSGQALRLSCIYCALGALWIVLSDRVAEFLFPDPRAYAVVQTWKGWFYVLATALLLYLLARGNCFRTLSDALALRVSQRKLDAALSETSLGVWELTPPDALELDEAWASRHGLSGKTSLEELAHPEDLPVLREAVAACDAKDRRVFEAEFRLRREEGASPRWFLCRGEAVEFDPGGRPARYAGAFLDITRRREDEHRLRATLAEKEVLLREVHHRVKNNMQVMLSLLRLQADGAQDPLLREALSVTSGRIQAMSMVHEEFYAQPDQADIDFTAYLERLSDRMLKSAARKGNIRLERRMAALRLPLDAAVSCGLICNELLDNALRHAARGTGADVRLELELRAGQVVLRVCDDGPGLPEGFDPAAAGTLGLTLVHSLAAHLRGRVSLDGSSGLRVEVVFPLTGFQATAALP